MSIMRQGDFATYYEVEGKGTPVLLIHGLGSSTEVTDADMCRMFDARKVVIADSLHATAVDQAEAFNEKVLDFISHVDHR